MESALIKKHEETLARDPNSRVFAQLGELYRKVGMLDYALRVFREGVKRHPTYHLGYLGLAYCYYDLEQYQLAYATLRPLVETSRDNLRFQRLFAYCCEKLEYKDEALETWKYLLFINPKDQEASAKVTSLENVDSHGNNDLASPQAFEIDNIHASPIDDVDDWIRVDLAMGDEKNIDKPQIKEESNLISLIQGETHELTDQYEDEIEKSNDAEAPIVSLTLVDLYMAQGHTEKAKEILSKMLELNPNDERVQEKLKVLDLSENIEEDDHSKLLRIVEQKQQFLKEEVDEQLEEFKDSKVSALNNFLQKIKQKASQKTSQI